MSRVRGNYRSGDPTLAEVSTRSPISTPIIYPLTHTPSFVGFWLTMWPGYCPAPWQAMQEQAHLPGLHMACGGRDLASRMGSSGLN